MGRHRLAEGRHRRQGALLAQAGLVSVLILVAAAVLFGSGIAHDRMVSGTLVGSQTTAETITGIDTPATSPELSASRSGAFPASTSAVTSTPSSDRVDAPTSRGADAPAAPMSSANTDDPTGTTTSSAATSSARSAEPSPETTTVTITVTVTADPIPSCAPAGK